MRLRFFSMGGIGITITTRMHSGRMRTARFGPFEGGGRGMGRLGDK